MADQAIRRCNRCAGCANCCECEYSEWTDGRPLCKCSSDWVSRAARAEQGYYDVIAMQEETRDAH